MSDFIDSYSGLLIYQYQTKTKAKSHITAYAEEYEKIYNLLNSLPIVYDIDLAVGRQLDVIGRILGISRKVPFAVAKKYFGFDDNSDSYPMDNLNASIIAYPFKDLNEPDYTSGELNDNQYRLFLKGKAIKNNVKALMIDEDENLSLQNAIDFLFSNKAFVIDNQDMTLTIYIDTSYDLSLLQYIKQLDLIPRPQGVDYRLVLSYVEGDTFGFSDNANSKPMGDLNIPSLGGKFAEIIEQ